MTLYRQEVLHDSAIETGVAFYALIGLALAGAAIAAALVEWKPKSAPRAKPVEVAAALEEAA
jgi:hypothetical protein